VRRGVSYIMKIGYNGATAIKRSNLELDLELCEKYGFDFMELRVSILEDFFRNGGTVEKITGLFAKSKVKPHAMNACEFFNMKSGQEFEKIKEDFDKLCSLTSNLGSSLVLAAPTPGVNAPPEIIMDNTVDCLRHLSDIAATYGLNVALEFIGLPGFSVNKFDQAYSIVEKVDRENVGCVIDLYHFHINGSSVDDIRKADGKKIFMVHINDAEDRPAGTFDSDSYRLMPGDGVIATGEIFKALKSIGYKGIMSVELFNPKIWEWDPEMAIMTASLKSKQIINKYWDASM